MAYVSNRFCTLVWHTFRMLIDSVFLVSVALVVLFLVFKCKWPYDVLVQLF